MPPPPRPLTKVVLVPLWILHIVFVTVLLTALVFLILEITGESDTGYLPTTYIVFLVFTVLCLVSEPVEMVLRSFALLSVASYLTSQIVKALFWSIYLAMAIAAWAQESNRPDFFEAWVWITSVVVVVTVTSSYYASLAYGIVACVREYRKDIVYEEVQEIKYDGRLGTGPMNDDRRSSRHARDRSSTTSTLLVGGAQA